MGVKQTFLSVTIEGRDVSDEVSADLLSFGYTDKETDEADDIRLTLMDPEGKWAGSWNPDGGEKVTARILSGDGFLDCGTFNIDSLRCSGSPRVMEIGAVSIPLDTPIRRRTRSKAWEKTDLRSIASSISGESGLSLLWDVSDDAPVYERIDQNRETDLKFLARLCKDAGLSIKVTAERLVIFDQASYEKKEPVDILILGVDPILSWSFSTEKGQSYRTCTVSYRDPAKKVKGTSASYYNRDFEKVTQKPAKKSSNPAVMTCTVTDTHADENGQEFQLKKMCRSFAEAESLAKAKLRELNARSVTGSMTMVGNTSLVAGTVIEVAGFGAWDGRFIVEAAKHSVGSGGYTTALDLRRVNADY